MSGTAWRETTIETDRGSIPTYEAFPTTVGPWPAVVVVHEVWGVNDDIRRIANRLASSGYITYAPDLVEGGKLRCIVRAFRDLQSEGGDTFADLRAVIDTVARRREVADGRVGVIGFCLGGGFALLAGTLDGVGAVSANYGRVPSEDTLAELCPVVASYGAKDRSFAKQAVRLEEQLEQHGIEHDVKVYPDAGHSFMNDGGPAAVRVLGRIMNVGYHSDSAEDAWQRILTFFNQQI